MAEDQGCIRTLLRRPSRPHALEHLSLRAESGCCLTHDAFEPDTIVRTNHEGSVRGAFAVVEDQVFGRNEQWHGESMDSKFVARAGALAEDAGEHPLERRAVAQSSAMSPTGAVEKRRYRTLPLRWTDHGEESVSSSSAEWAAAWASRWVGSHSWPSRTAMPATTGRARRCGDPSGFAHWRGRPEPRIAGTTRTATRSVSPGRWRSPRRRPASVGRGARVAVTHACGFLPDRTAAPRGVGPGGGHRRPRSPTGPHSTRARSARSRAPSTAGCGAHSRRT